MALVSNSEEVTHVDRVMAIAFREARDLGAAFITRSWVAKRLKRSERWVTDNWNKDPYDCKKNTTNIGLGGRTISLQSREIIKNHAGRQKKSVRRSGGGHTDY